MEDDLIFEDATTSHSAMFESDDEDVDAHVNIAGSAQSSFLTTTHPSRRRSLLVRSRSRPLRTPSSPMATTLPHNNLPSAPASPPTPAPSPSPHRRLPDWSEADEREETLHRGFRATFKDALPQQKERILAELLNLCDSRQLNFVHDFVCPRLKKDPFTTLPNEICLRVRPFVLNPTLEILMTNTFGSSRFCHLWIIRKH